MEANTSHVYDRQAKGLMYLLTGIQKLIWASILGYKTQFKSKPVRFMAV